MTMDNCNLSEPTEPAVDDARRALAALLPAFAFVPTSASAQDATKAQPAAYKVVLDNERLRVLEFNSRPGMGVCGSGVHSHPAHLTVVLSDNARARVKQDGKTFEATNKLGDVFWSEAETHEVENISGRNMRALIVELKTKA